MINNIIMTETYFDGNSLKHVAIKFLKIATRKEYTFIYWLSCFKNRPAEKQEIPILTSN